ncbi:HNH endonuclease [Yersinia enterocolitica]|uniref:HNH endonuclease n=1 Tax=Yersinia TaxID=629 RepID=UPI0005E525F1|nr:MULTISPECIES: HNH endonuclease [Yersinia]EKN3395577.1 HNH endonuclease [Yersinia enterocolitica]EKN3501140.1 HNH endonuclease [Yersinia enterocolitica]EKN3636592.1 HNH endonuclease [Yersinia enterocolitica]EKN3687154.1 HNH endonuclease [Yersinia enterocolitica]EKN3832488.1 HNH endonuclease [Yersinia enterocolitica]
MLTSSKIFDRRQCQPIIGVKRKVWRQDDEHADEFDTEFQEIRTTVLKRDNYTCKFCTFKSLHYQEVHHIDDDHSNNSPSNLVTVCSLCHQVHHLGIVAIKGSGFISYIPELTQTEINWIVRTIFVLLHNLKKDDPVINQLHSLYSVFQERGADTLKGVFYHGEKSVINLSSPIVLAQYLSLCDDNLFKDRVNSLEGLVVVPTIQAFHSKQLETYFHAQGAANNKKESYEALFDNLISNL